MVPVFTSQEVATQMLLTQSTKGATQELSKSGFFIPYHPYTALDRET